MPGQPARRGERVFIPDGDDFINHVGIQNGRDEPGSDTLNLGRAGLAALHS